eukprot:2913347-Prorocentrum_lima.AAC.1
MEQHSLAFYLLWNRYHWESHDGAETTVVQLRCPMWQSDEGHPALLAVLGDRAVLPPDDFMVYMSSLLTMRRLGA